MEDPKAAGLLIKTTIQALGAGVGWGRQRLPRGAGEDSDEEADLLEPLDPGDGEISVPSDMH